MTVARCEAMDDLPATPYNVLAHGVAGYVEGGCPGCGATIYAERGDGGSLRLHAYAWEGWGPVLHEEATGDVWCCGACFDAGRTPKPRFREGGAR